MIGGDLILSPPILGGILLRGSDDVGPRGSSRCVLLAVGGREEGGENVGPAPPPSGIHHGGSCAMSFNFVIKI